MYTDHDLYKINLKTIFFLFEFTNFYMNVQGVWTRFNE